MSDDIWIKFLIHCNTSCSSMYIICILHASRSLGGDTDPIQNSFFVLYKSGLHTKCYGASFY